MKPWLAKTLLGSAIALVVLAGSWLLLDAKWSGALEERRASEAVLARELLPALATAEDAGPECSAALDRLTVWSWIEARSRFEQAEQFLGEDRSRPECWSADELARFDFCDAPEVQGSLDEIEAALARPHCRLFEVCDSGGSWRYVPNCAVWFPRFLERECWRELLRGNRERAAEHVESAFALAAHAREVPTVGACRESDYCALRAIGTLHFLAERGELDAALALRIQPWLANIQPEADWLRAIDGERVLYGQYAWAGLREGTAPNGITHPTDPLGLLYSKLLRPWRLFEETRYEALLDEKRSLVEQSPWVKLPRPEISPLFQITRTLTTFTELDGERRLRVRHARDLAELALRLMIAREASGEYPAALDGLGERPREPLTDADYAYARGADGCTLGDWRLPR